jgi:hypothetical protein
MIDRNFEYTSNLQYKVKHLTAQVKAFKSGDKYIKLQELHKRELQDKDLEIKKLKNEVKDGNHRLQSMNTKWMQILDDVEKETEAILAKKGRRIKELEKRAFAAEADRDTIKDKLREKTAEVYRVGIELEEEKGKNLKLTAQINRDYENSSLSSSLKPNHKKIMNSREKTSKKPGAQPGHEGHGRKRLTPTRSIFIPPPAEYAENPNFTLTKKTIRKQLINVYITVDVCEYATPEYRNKLTGGRVHAKFPDGVVNDVNYGGNIKALALLLNTNCCVSINKVRELLSELTNGELNISNGMINGLCKDFAKRTKDECKKIFSDMMLSPVMQTDFTSVRVSGKNANVCVCATPDGLVMFFAREHKGHKGIKGTPVEDFQGILVHDHDKTFYSYGTNHQECSSHILRYLKDSIENEPTLKWNKQMRELIREAIHYRNSLGDNDVIDITKVEEIERRYDEIIKLGNEEYEYEPPSNYYKDGYNLHKRLQKYKDKHLLFLHNLDVPADNNLSERLLRNVKRKQKQMMTMRSFPSTDALCSCMTMINSLRTKKQDLYNSISQVFT